jgi:hypothetical protein
MAFTDTAKPATAETVNGLRNVERFAGGLDHHNILNLIDIQALRLTRRFAISLPVAMTIAGLHFGEAVR